MRYMLHMAYLLAFALTLQVFHVHLDVTEDDAVQCVMCVNQADDDVVASSSKPAQQHKQSSLAHSSNVLTPLSSKTPQQARSPPTISI